MKIKTEDTDLYFINLTVDLAFKLVFGEAKNIELLKALLKDITKLPIERLEGLGLKSEELHRDSIIDHKTIVDVRAILNDNTQIEIEMQVRNYHDMDKRSLYTWAKMYSSQLNKNDPYIKLAKCICINITAFDFTKENSGHNKYAIKNIETNEAFTNDLEIHFIELPKRGKVDDMQIRKWMALLASKTWEEMERNAEGDDIMKQVYNQAKNIAMNETQRINVENREKFLIDQNNLEYYARKEGKLEVAKKLAELGMPIEQIIEVTELSAEEIQKL